MSRTSLATQWLGLHCFHCRGPGFNPGWGTRILQAAQHAPQHKKICLHTVLLSLVLFFCLFVATYLPTAETTNFPTCKPHWDRRLGPRQKYLSSRSFLSMLANRYSNTAPLPSLGLSCGSCV